MKKFVSFLLAAVALAFSCAVMAAPGTVKGINGNGIQESVGVKPVFAIKHVDGITYYRSQIGSGTVYKLQDADKSRHNAIKDSFNLNAAVTVDGWIYDLSKVSVICQSNQSVVTIGGIWSSDYLSDNCAFATTANGT